jgi:hypothetical protein
LTSRLRQQIAVPRCRRCRREWRVTSKGWVPSHVPTAGPGRDGGSGAAACGRSKNRGDPR